MLNKGKMTAVTGVVLSFAPIWKSGGRHHLNFWQWVLNHTIWGPPSEYIPEEDYQSLRVPWATLK